MAEAEGAGEGGLGTPVEGRVGSRQALAPMLAGTCRTLVLVHLALVAAVAWGHIHVDVRSHGALRQSPRPAPQTPGQPKAKSGQQLRICSRIPGQRETHQWGRDDHGSLNQLSTILVILPEVRDCTCQAACQGSVGITPVLSHSNPGDRCYD